MINTFYDLNNPLNLFLYGLTEGHSLSKQEKKVTYLVEKTLQCHIIALNK